MNWWRFVLDLLPLSWMLLPAPAVAFAPARYLRPTGIAAGVFYGALLAAGYMTEDRICGDGCAIGLLIVPLFILGVILTGIAFVVRTTLVARKR